jgi:hypothetical protein
MPDQAHRGHGLKKRVSVMETCPCCGYKTLPEKHLYDICPICFWEDDIVQFEDPDFEGGANIVSLRQAQGILLSMVQGKKGFFVMLENQIKMIYLIQTGSSWWLNYD